MTKPRGYVILSVGVLTHSKGATQSRTFISFLRLFYFAESRFLAPLSLTG
nr:MAG TPA: hypothetical protein [Caudoviricetes sp.]